MSTNAILTLNAGSATIKFAIFAGEIEDGPAALTGVIEQFGPKARLRAGGASGPRIDRLLTARDHAEGLQAILELVREALPSHDIAAVGHRIVHGGPHHAAPVRIDAGLIADLERLVPLAPLHQPHNLAGVRAAAAAFPDSIQVACFDTAFHRGHPMVADMYGIPLRFHEEGVRRYGFHGISYEYLTLRLTDVAPAVAKGRVILAHLGNGASLCAVRDGMSLASTMGFSPLDGVPMGTRCGQIDPAVLLYLMTEKGMDAKAIGDLLYRQSGLAGISGLSNDMRDLEASEAPAAQLAIAYFVHRIRREIGALAADLGGLDALVFAGGIGEKASRIRAAILEGLGHLGLELDPAANDAHAQRVSPIAARVPVLVIPTDEEWMIARYTRRTLRAA